MESAEIINQLEDTKMSKKEWKIKVIDLNKKIRSGLANGVAYSEYADERKALETYKWAKTHDARIDNRGCISVVYTPSRHDFDNIRCWL